MLEIQNNQNISFVPEDVIYTLNLNGHEFGFYGFFKFKEYNPKKEQDSIEFNKLIGKDCE